LAPITKCFKLIIFLNVKSKEGDKQPEDPWDILCTQPSGVGLRVFLFCFSLEFMQTCQ
jgi:hypothetical protein